MLPTDASTPEIQETTVSDAAQLAPDFAVAPPATVRVQGICLPDRVVAGAGVSCSITEDCLRVVGPSRGQAIWMEPGSMATCVDVVRGRRPVATLDGMERSVIAVLAASGLLTDPAQPRGWDRASGFNLIALLLDEIDRLQEAVLLGNRLITGIAAGKVSERATKGWILESYFYTSSARRHISPVLEHPLDAFERCLWEEFLKEEATHWRIYRKVFQFLGWDWNLRANLEANAATNAFIDTLAAMARISPYAYSAGLMFIEQTPVAATLEDDDLYGGLVKHYGFPHWAVNPMWIHANLNQDLGHETLGQTMVSRKPLFEAKELSGIRAALADLFSATAWMLDSILGDYGDAAHSDRRFSALIRT